MKTFEIRTCGLVMVVLAVWLLGGCVSEPKPAGDPLQVAGKPGNGQPTYAAAQAAADALVAAAKNVDLDKASAEVHNLLGPGWVQVASGDPTADRNGVKRLAARALKKMELVREIDGRYWLHLGKDGWPFAIPIVRAADGRWFLDTMAGKDELLARRVGHNELAAIQFCRAYVQAQREYAGKDRDGSEVLRYAQRFRSQDGMRDGLYWAPVAGEDLSPLGSFVADAASGGYDLTKHGAGHLPFHGYLFRILKGQGEAAPGGRYNYVINGNMIAGFGLVAFPDKYRVTGVMTFLVNHQGKVYQKDLGPNSADLASRLTTYNPDKTWTQVRD